MTTRTHDYDKDLEAVIAIVSAKDKDAEALAKARESADRTQAEMREKYGVREIAVDLVHEARDGQ